MILFCVVEDFFGGVVKKVLSKVKSAAARGIIASKKSADRNNLVRRDLRASMEKKREMDALHAEIKVLHERGVFGPPVSVKESPLSSVNRLRLEADLAHQKGIRARSEQRSRNKSVMAGIERKLVLEGLKWARKNRVPRKGN